MAPFGSGHTAFSWQTTPDCPVGTTMPRPLKITFLVVGGLLGFLIVVGIVGVATMEPDGPETTPEAATSTSTTTTAPKTIATLSALQEIFADLTEQDCAEEVIGYGDAALAMSDTLTAMLGDIEAGLLTEAEWDYWQLWGQKTAALDDYALWMEVCASKSSPALVAEVTSFTPIVQEAWNALEASCLAELRAQGWDCFPAN